VKVLNLYAGIGGNRKLWQDCQVTAVEINLEIARIYKDFFPEDNVIVGDAHEYLLETIKNKVDYDFIWSSPPCQSHSRVRQILGVRRTKALPMYPDMSLWQEILLLKNNFAGKWVVENVKPYYEALVSPTVAIDRNLFWSNFRISRIKYFPKVSVEWGKIKDWESVVGFDLSTYKIPKKIQILRNCVIPEVGKHILDQAFKNEQLEFAQLEQTELNA
jgi:DNA (cytosine-5)-methyltransferase 1